MNNNKETIFQNKTFKKYYLKLGKKFIKEAISYQSKKVKDK